MAAPAISLPLKSGASGNTLLWGIYVVCLIGLIVIPLPALLLDALVAINFGLAFLLLFAVLYARSFIDLSTFPTLILLTTVLRLSVSVATSRAVLSGEDPGSIVKAFGNYVVAGSLAVGLTIFLVILIVQFMVVTKGAERISEVSARFTLDSLPGRQMSIEADARAGKIDGDEASRQRKALREESQLIGALEGAMRFVKGDAIATFIIVFLNLVGGMAIAIIERGDSFSGAIEHYLILSIGDGVVAQLPSMLSGLAAGILITRSGAASGDVGNKMSRELSAHSSVMAGTAAVVAGMAIIPGFPTGIMLFLSALVLGPAIHRWFTASRSSLTRSVELTPEEKASSAKFVQTASYMDQFVCRINPLDFACLTNAGFQSEMKKQRMETVRRCGLKIPIITFHSDPSQSEGAFSVSFEGVEKEIFHIDVTNIPTSISEITNGFDDVVYKEHVSSLTIDDMNDWLKEAELNFSALVSAVRALDQQVVLKSFRRLLQENVSVAHARPVLESFVMASSDGDPTIQSMVEEARLAMRTLIRKSIPGEVIVFSDEDELVVEAGRLMGVERDVDTFDGFINIETAESELGSRFSKIAEGKVQFAFIVPDRVRFFVSTLMLSQPGNGKVFSASEYGKPNQIKERNEIS
jgi:type III secretion protein V